MGVDPVVWSALSLPLILGVALGVHFYLRRRERLRSEALRGESARMGLAFEAEGDHLRHESFFFLPLFSQGRSKTFRNVMRGSDELVFGFEFTTGYGKHQRITRQTVAAFRAAGADFPAFHLKPENLADRIASQFGGQDIDFPEDPEFSKAFRLQGNEQLMIRELFTGATRHRLLNHRDWYLQGSREWVLAFRSGLRPDPSDLVSFVETARSIAEPFLKR